MRLFVDKIQHAPALDVLLHGWSVTQQVCARCACVLGDVLTVRAGTHTRLDNSLCMCDRQQRLLQHRQRGRFGLPRCAQRRSHLRE
jgi:hypothetical protein